MSSTALSEKADSSAGTSCWVASSPLMPLSWMRTVGAEAACLVGAARVREVKRRVDARVRSVDFMFCLIWEIVETMICVGIVR